MSEIGRRGLLKLMGTAPLAAGLRIGEAEAQSAHQPAVAGTKAALALGKGYVPRFFTAHEWQTVRLLSDLVIPRDERSGSATDALVPEFIDNWMVDNLATDKEREQRQTAMRGGLAWLDLECGDRYSGQAFVECTESERTQVLDDIAWPKKAKPEHSQGVAFFSHFRDLTASGFWSSKVGVDDLQYMGNVFVAEWKGCPPEVLQKLGLPTD
jgi:gluconate 2-dehydrogenase gamma chain